MELARAHQIDCSCWITSEAPANEGRRSADSPLGLGETKEEAGVFHSEGTDELPTVTGYCSLQWLTMPCRLGSQRQRSTKGNGNSEFVDATVPTEGFVRLLQRRLWQSISEAVVAIGNNNNDNGNWSKAYDKILSGWLIWEGRVMLYLACYLFLHYFWYGKKRLGYFPLKVGNFLQGVGKLD